jgi:hypothetical protein
MTRLARIVIPGLPHHVTQRGNRRERVFFSDEDYQFYLDELGAAEKSRCQLPNFSNEPTEYSSVYSSPQSRSNSLIPVFPRVFSSTVFTITTQ